MSIKYHQTTISIPLCSHTFLNIVPISTLILTPMSFHDILFLHTNNLILQQLSILRVSTHVLSFFSSLYPLLEALANCIKVAITIKD